MKHGLLPGMFIAGLLLLTGMPSVPQASGHVLALHATRVRQTPAPPPEPIKLAELAPWLTSVPADYRRGGLLAVAGLVGALVTVFFLVGGAVPGTAGQAKIDADSKQLELLSKRLGELISASRIDAPVVEAVEKTVNNLRDDLRSESWRQYAIASTLYAILGASIAALLAKDLLQAFVIGAGWTGFIGSLGLKRDYAERKAIKDTALGEALSVATAAKLEPGQQMRALAPEGLDRLERNVRVAQAL